MPRRRCCDSGIDLELVGRTNKTGFVVEPRRWKIEQTFGIACQRYRRLQVDHEGSTGHVTHDDLARRAVHDQRNRFERQIRA